MVIGELIVFLYIKTPYMKLDKLYLVIAVTLVVAFYAYVMFNI